MKQPSTHSGPRLLLVTASSPEMQSIRRNRVLNFQQITMPYLAAFVPSHWSVHHIDEVVEQVQIDDSFDLVALTFHTPSAPHAYAIADAFRALGVYVVLGGPHVTLLPEEAEKHADTIFVGEAEEGWPLFLSDFEVGRAAARYTCKKAPTLDQIPMARKDFFVRRDHTSGVLFATRGCPHRCDFCTVAAMYENQLRRRPIADVVEEFFSFRGKVIILWDDNIAADMTYAKELFAALIPARKWWSSQASVLAASDSEFLRLAARSGCKQLFIGLESICQSSLNAVGKTFNRVHNYAEAIARIHSHGIAVQAGIVFGFDHDTPAVFDQTSRFLEDSGVQNATFNLLTPFPGTPLFNRFHREGRIRTYDWSRYNGRADVVYEPSQMTADELLRGYRKVCHRFYSGKSILRRFSRSPVQWAWSLPLNMAYAMALRRGEGNG